MSKKEIARQTILQHLQSPQWKNTHSIRKLFTVMEGNYQKQWISDSTIYRVLDELVRVDLIDCKWVCRFPRFYLIYTLKKEDTIEG